MKRKNVCLALLLLLALMGAASRAQQVDFHPSGAQRPQDLIPPPSGDLTKPPWAKTVEILSDTQGVDFDPYILQAVRKIKTNWYNYIPEEARPPQLKYGETTIEFAILKDGRIAGMRIVQQAEIPAMDRAAWGGLIASNPFDPLPKKFNGNFLKLRMHFYYNPEKKPATAQPTSPPASSSADKPEPH